MIERNNIILKMSILYVKVIKYGEETKTTVWVFSVKIKTTINVWKAIRDKNT